MGIDDGSECVGDRARDMTRIYLPFLKSKTAIEPSYAKPGDAGLDLVAVEAVRIPAGERALVEVGIMMAIPYGYVGFVCPRSGLALNHGITVLNAPGVIDSGYRGDIGVVLYNTNPMVDRLGTLPPGHNEFVVNAGDRVAQLVIVPVAEATLSLVQKLSETVRGAGSFGSTD